MKKQHHPWQAVPPGWKINLDKFCSDEPGTKYPILIDGYIYASNGSVLIKTEFSPFILCDRIEVSEEWINKTSPRVDEFMLRPTHQGYWVSYPLLKETLLKREATSCPECHGIGNVDLGHNWIDDDGEMDSREYIVDCEGCECSGEIEIPSVFDNHSFSHRAVSPLRGQLPDLRVFTPIKDGILYFKFTAGVGIIKGMSIRKSPLKKY